MILTLFLEMILDSFPVMMDYDCYLLDIWISHLPATATCKFYL